MPALSALVFLALPLVGLAAPHDHFARRHHNASLEARAAYTLKDHYTGNDFLCAPAHLCAFVSLILRDRNWDFFSGGDPTHGAVNYLTKSEAAAKGLAYVQKDGTAILAVDSKSKLGAGENRDSCVHALPSCVRRR